MMFGVCKGVADEVDNKKERRETAHGVGLVQSQWTWDT